MSGTIEWLLVIAAVVGVSWAIIGIAAYVEQHRDPDAGNNLTKTLIQVEEVQRTNQNIIADMEEEG